MFILSNEEKFLLQSNLLYLNMQETWTFQLSKELGGEPPERIVEKIISKEKKDFGIFLSYYFRKEGAVVENVAYKSHAVDNTSLKGNVIVSFDLIHYNACLNIHEQGKEDMTLSYQIDTDSKSIEFTGPYWPEREMDDI